MLSINVHQLGGGVSLQHYSFVAIQERMISAGVPDEPEGEKNHKKGGLNCVFGNFFFNVLDDCPQVQSLK